MTDHPRAFHSRCEHVEVQVPDCTEFNVDGEVVTEGDARFRAVRGAFRLVIGLMQVMRCVRRLIPIVGALVVIAAPSGWAQTAAARPPPTSASPAPRSIPATTPPASGSPAGWPAARRTAACRTSCP